MDEQYALVPSSMGKNTKMFMYAMLIATVVLVMVTFGSVQEGRDGGRDEHRTE